MKKTLLTRVTIFAIVFSLNLFLFAFASEQSYDNCENIVISPQNVAIIEGYNNIAHRVIGKLTCEGQTEVIDGYFAGITMELQEYKNKEWSTIKTWTKIDSNYASIVENYFVVKGTYRLKLTHRAYNSNMKQVESLVKYSKTIIYE